MNRGAWRATVSGVKKSQTQLSIRAHIYSHKDQVTVAGEFQGHSSGNSPKGKHKARQLMYKDRARGFLEEELL